MAEAEIVQLETEQQKAERYKAEMHVALVPVLTIINNAKRDGLLMEFHLGNDAYGRAFITDCAVIKRF